MAKLHAQRAITPEGILRYLLYVRTWKDILVLNIVNKFDTVLIKIALFRAVLHRNCDFFNKGQ